MSVQPVRYHSGKLQGSHMHDRAQAPGSVTPWVNA